MDERNKKKLKDQMQKRNIELGVGSKTNQNEDIKALIFKEPSIDAKKMIDSKISLP